MNTENKNLDLILNNEDENGVRFIFACEKKEVFSFLLSTQEVTLVMVHLMKYINEINLKEANEYKQKVRDDQAQNTVENGNTESKRLDSTCQQSSNT